MKPSPTGSGGVQAAILTLALAVALLHALVRPFSGLDAAGWDTRLAARWEAHAKLRELDYRVDGLDLTVTGWIGDEAEREAVFAAVQDALPAGRSRVRDEVQVMGGAWLVVEKDGDRVALHGQIRELGDVAWLPADWDLSDQREAHPGVTVEPWDEGIASVVRVFLERASSGTLEVRGEEMVLAGFFPDEAARTGVLEEAAAVWGSGVRIIDRSEVVASPVPVPVAPVVDVPAPVVESTVPEPPAPEPKAELSPPPPPLPPPLPTPSPSLLVPGPELSVQRDGRVIVLVGKMRDYDQRAAVEAAVRAEEPDLAIRNRIAVEEDLPDAAWLESFASWWPELVRRIPDVTVEIGSRGVVVGGGPADAEARKGAEEIVARTWGKQINFRDLVAAP